MLPLPISHFKNRINAPYNREEAGRCLLRSDNVAQCQE
jgi:hypothetical protein